MNLLRSLAILPILLLCCACSSLTTSVERPTLAMQGMEVANITTTGFTMLFDVEIENPNDIAIPLADVDYQLKLAGNELIDGKTPGRDQRVPARGAMPYQLPVNVTFQNLLNVGNALRGSNGNVPYEIETEFRFEQTRGLLGSPITVPLRFSGTLPLRELTKDPTILLRSPAARKVAEQALEGIFSR